MIAGEVRRYLRDNSAIRVSRSLRDTAYKVLQCKEAQTAALGREPTLSELSARTGISPEDIACAETAIDPVISLQSSTGEDGLTLEGLLSEGNGEDAMVERIDLRKALGEQARKDSVQFGAEHMARSYCDVYSF